VTSESVASIAAQMGLNVVDTMKRRTECD
jgi:hypothetical protein